MTSAGRGRGLLPGMNPRPQKLFVKKQGVSEEVHCDTKSTFVFIEKCEDFNLDIHDKVGKVVCEGSKNVSITVRNRIVGGTLELIHCQGIEIKLVDAAEVPVFTVDGSSQIEIIIKNRGQMQSVYVHDSSNITVTVATTGEDVEGQVQKFVVDTENKETYDTSGEPVQWVSHWKDRSQSADLVTERVVRDGIYPSTAQMIQAAQQREQVALNRFADLLFRPAQSRRQQTRPPKEPPREEASKEATEKSQENKGTGNTTEASASSDTAPSNSQSQPEVTSGASGNVEPDRSLSKVPKVEAENEMDNVD